MKKYQVVLLFISMLILGGCGRLMDTVKEVQKPSFKDVVVDGKIDLKLAKQAGYVTQKEQEKLGYATVDNAQNPRLQKQLIEHKDEIIKTYQPLIEEAIDRQVEILDLDAIFPYASYSIEFKTVDAPYVYESVTVAWADSGYDVKGHVSLNYGEGELGSGLVSDTVNGLVAMVYKDDIKKHEDEFLKQFPQYEAFPKGCSERTEMNGAYLFGVWENDNDNKGTKEIYDIYKSGVIKSDEEWRELFKEKKIYYGLSVRLVLKDPEIVPITDMFDELNAYFEENEVYKNFLGFSLSIDSQLVNSSKARSLFSIDSYPENNIENRAKENLESGVVFNESN